MSDLQVVSCTHSGTMCTVGTCSFTREFRERVGGETLNVLLLHLTGIVNYLVSLDKTAILLPVNVYS